MPERLSASGGPKASLCAPPERAILSDRQWDWHQFGEESAVVLQTLMRLPKLALDLV
jgi:hypothetical protein